MLGLFLILLSSLLYASLIIIPFLKISTSIKLGMTPAIVIIGEITFWIGGILVGKELIFKYRRFFNPLNWIKKKESSDKNGNNVVQ